MNGKLISWTHLRDGNLFLKEMHTSYQKMKSIDYIYYTFKNENEIRFSFNYVSTKEYWSNTLYKMLLSKSWKLCSCQWVDVVFKFWICTIK